MSKDNNIEGFRPQDFKDGFRVLTNLLDRSKVGFVLMGEDFNVLDANESFADMLGYELEEVKKLHLWDWNPEFDAEEMESLRENKTWFNAILEQKNRRKDGKLLDVMVSVDAKMIGGEVLSFCIMVDQTERKRLERALERKEARLNSFVENSKDILFGLDSQGIISYFSPNVKKLYRMDPRMFLGKNYVDFILPEYRDDIRSKVAAIIDGEVEHASAEYQIYGMDGNTHWVATSFSLSMNDDDRLEVIGISRHIDEQKAYEERLTYLSFHDALTGLYNRAYYEDAIARLEKGRSAYPITVFSMDIDGLKAVNDTIGHHEGDKLIIRCADFLRSIFRTEDLIARLGGDEFVVLLPRTGEEFVLEVEKRLLRELEIFNKGEKVPLSLSYGFATSYNMDDPIHQTYIKTDDLLLDAKRKRINDM
ncbi:PAS domain S-box protein [Alkalibacter rhizosphaerae]|uniref:PAS domain S-box protein n=1 Tax=Alkalibacter rhizosphaerae TaxID=2815577 RepID=A0A974XKZ6_9FIRM|nr:sensor domain-containing diguanylate cyclase [Alkalibacter rhizosphaerae]QSX07891.1 PAS domain S-box protein [Alkalibacter rhizosphaerae]